MRKAGCAQILIGLEDPGEGADGAALRANWKDRQYAHYVDFICRIQDAGITVNGCFELGLDAHTPATFDPLWDFIRKSGLYEVQITVMTAFPGTPLHARLQSANRIIDARRTGKVHAF